VNLRLFNLILAPFFAFLCFQGNAQSFNATGDSINRKDASGKPVGQWFISHPEGIGESKWFEYGTYDHGYKTGTWYKVNGEGLVTAIEGFKNNVLNGEVKYYEHGTLSCLGHYRGLNPATVFDTFLVVDPVNDSEIQRVVRAEKGTMRHGTWKYYDEQTHRLVKEEEYQVDELIYSKNYLEHDSLYYKQHENEMPHKKKVYYRPPEGSFFSYLD